MTSGVATRTGTADQQAATAGERAWLWRNRDLVATPVIVVLGLAGVAAYVFVQELDTVERRILTVGGPGGLLDQLSEHLLLTTYSTLIVIAIAVPIGVALSRPALGRIRSGVLVFGGFMQALPPFGLLILFAFSPLGFGTSTAVIGLVVASFLPVLTNTVVGLRQVDAALIEAARGMGMSARQTLLRVELPLAVPVMVAGIRVALVLGVGTAALAVYIGAGGLGVPIVSALKLGRIEVAFVVAALVAALALLVDWLAGVAERLVGGVGD